MRVDQVDGPQLRGVREQRGGRRFHAWRDNAADEAPVRVDDFHIGGRAEIHHDHGGAVQRLRGHGGGHAVGPDFMRVGIVGLEQRARRFGRAHERVLPDHAIRGRAPCHGERGHHRGQRHAANIIELQALGRQQRHQFHTELVGGMAFVRGHTPPILQAPVLVDPHYGLRISHVDGK